MNVVTYLPLQSRYRVFVSTQNVSIHSFETNSFSPISSSWKPLICFVFLSFGLYLKCHINGIIQYTAFCLSLFSLTIMLLKFICVVAFISGLFLLMKSSVPLHERTTVCLHIHLLIGCLSCF